MASLVSHWWALVDVISCNLHNRCDSRTFDRTKLNMFNPCESWAKPLSHVRLHVQLQLHVCLHGAIVAAIGRATDRGDDRLV